MPSRPLVAATLALCLVAGCAQAPLSPREVAEQAALHGEPITAEELIKAYGVLTGRAAELVDAAYASRSIGPASDTGENTWRCGEGLGETAVTEYTVLGEPYRIEVWGWHRTDAYDKLRAEDVDFIYYGHEPPPEGMPDEGLLRDRPGRDTERLAGAAHGQLHVPVVHRANRPWRIGDGPVRHSPLLPIIGVGISFDPTLGVHIHLKSGEVTKVACYVKGDWCDGPHFRNIPLSEVLKQIARKQGVHLSGDWSS